LKPEGLLKAMKECNCY